MLVLSPARRWIGSLQKRLPSHSLLSQAYWAMPLPYDAVLFGHLHQIDKHILFPHDQLFVQAICDSLVQGAFEFHGPAAFKVSE